jgi:vacuolar protein sorting-associated protein IST1
MSYVGKNSKRAETSRVESQDISTVNAPAQQFHSYRPESLVYERPIEPPRAHSPEGPHFDDFYERESDIGTSYVYPVKTTGYLLDKKAPKRHVISSRKVQRKPSNVDHYDSQITNLPQSVELKRFDQNKLRRN